MPWYRMAAVRSRSLACIFFGVDNKKLILLRLECYTLSSRFMYESDLPSFRICVYVTSSHIYIQHTLQRFLRFVDRASLYNDSIFLPT